MSRKSSSIRLNKKLYKIASIKDAIDDFGKVCRGKLSEEGDYFCVNLTAKDKPLEKNMEYEFANYVLALMKNKSLV